LASGYRIEKIGSKYHCIKEEDLGKQLSDVTKAVESSKQNTDGISS
jgi:hypothetical protein